MMVNGKKGSSILLVGAPSRDRDFDSLQVQFFVSVADRGSG